MWDAGFAAIEQIEAIVNAEGIDCQWKRVSGVKHLALAGGSRDDVKTLQEEARLARELGFDAEFVEDAPFVARPAAVFGGQARFHPRKYLRALAERISRQGLLRVRADGCDEVVDEPLSVKACGRTITCKYIVLATHTPLMGKTNIASATLLQTKLYLYTSYVVGRSRREGHGAGHVFWDTASPYHYLRLDERADHDFAIFGGNDHKTGQAGDTVRRFERLEMAARRAVPSVEITHRWSGQVVETNDGLPFIGESSSAPVRRDGLLGQRDDVRHARRDDGSRCLHGPEEPLAGAVRPRAHESARRSVGLPQGERRLSVLHDSRPHRRARRHVACGHCSAGEGKVLEIDGERVAASRGADGSVTMVSPVCTHMGCLVEWNRAEKTWDCPCHGSRFLPAARCSPARPKRRWRRTHSPAFAVKRRGKALPDFRVFSRHGRSSRERGFDVARMAALTAIAETRTAAGDVRVHHDDLVGEALVGRARDAKPAD